MSKTTMTKEEHLQRHRDLHRALDELVADFLTHNRTRMMRTTSVMDLMEWAYSQTIQPSEIEEERTP